MTYPQYQGDPAQQFQQPQYAPQPGQFQQPQYPALATFPGYAPQPQFAAPQAPPPAAPSVRATSLADFWDQRSGGEGKALSFASPIPVGTSYTFMVTRSLNKGDIVQQTDDKQVGLFNRDGSPKWVLVVPGVLPDGSEITWWCKGQAKTALQAQLELAGVPEVEAKSIITVTYTKDRPNKPPYQPTKIMDVVYRRPQGAGPVQAPVSAPAAPVVQAPAPVAPQVPSAPAANEDPAALFQSLLDS
jgi:hypothetical protein